MEPDLQTIDENLYDLYVTICDRDKTTPTISDYIIWIGENYD